MTPVVKLAWRNIWRNKRRTVLTIGAIAFGMFLITISRGIQYGTFGNMLDVSLRRSVGHLQVQRKGYWDERTLKYAFPVGGDDIAAIERIPGVDRVSPKLYTAALVGSGTENTTGALIVGVTPSMEQAMTLFATQPMEEGDFLSDGDTTGAVIGATLARNLEADVGDELVVLTQARDGSMAAALLDVRGIYRLADPVMDGGVVIAHLALLQHILAAEERATAIAMTVRDMEDVGAVGSALRQRFVDDEWAVMSYEDLLPQMMQFIAFKDAGNLLILIILLVVIVFGILNTILMTVMERFHEFGVMMAMGMRPGRIARMIFLEATLLSGVGLVVGNVAGYLLNNWWQYHPVIHPMEDISESYGFVPLILAVPDLTSQAIWSGIVLGLTLVMAMWPALVAMRFKPVEAIRQV